MEAETNAAPGADSRNLMVKTIGVGNAGIAVLELLLKSELAATPAIAINTDAQSLAASSASHKITVDRKYLRELAPGSEPPAGESPEQFLASLKSQCEGAEVVLLASGFGGSTGSRLAPLVAKVARQCGALVIAFVSLPFECEGSRRCRLADRALHELRQAADHVIALPNQKLLKSINEETSFVEVFKTTNELLAEAVRGIWRLLNRTGLIEIDFAEFCATVREHHAQSLFASAEAMGPTRSREVIDRLAAHPIFEGGQLLAESGTVLVSLMGGPDLTMAEVNRVMEEIHRRCDHAQVVMGAAIDESFRDRLAITLIAARRTTAAEESDTEEDLPGRLLNRTAPARPGSRFLPPPPALPPEKMQQLLARQNAVGGRGRKSSNKLRQSQLPLEIVSKGRFDKSEPTIHKGEDLDVPTYIRRGVALN